VLHSEALSPPPNYSSLSFIKKKLKKKKIKKPTTQWMGVGSGSVLVSLAIERKKLLLYSALYSGTTFYIKKKVINYLNNKKYKNILKKCE